VLFESSQVFVRQAHLIAFLFLIFLVVVSVLSLNTMLQEFLYIVSQLRVNGK
jgi:hypothetical protein